MESLMQMGGVSLKNYDLS